MDFYNVRNNGRNPNRNPCPRHPDPRRRHEYEPSAGRLIFDDEYPSDEAYSDFSGSVGYGDPIHFDDFNDRLERRRMGERAPPNGRRRGGGPSMPFAHDRRDMSRGPSPPPGFTRRRGFGPSPYDDEEDDLDERRWGLQEYLNGEQPPQPRGGLGGGRDGRGGRGGGRGGRQGGGRHVGHGMDPEYEMGPSRRDPRMGGVRLDEMSQEDFWNVPLLCEPEYAGMLGDMPGPRRRERRR
ncbi:MAG: hypothetical protein Q9219_003574 [cf. Caloplaca sp. 3 TL-2023]